MCDQAPWLAAPVGAAVIGKLEDSPNSPKKPDSCGEPPANRICSPSHRSAEPPRHRGENCQRYRNKPGMDLEDFPQQQRHPRKFISPFKEAHEKQVHDGDGQLRGSGYSEQLQQC